MLFFFLNLKYKHLDFYSEKHLFCKLEIKMVTCFWKWLIVTWIPGYLCQSDGKKMLIDFAVYISLNVGNMAQVFIVI